MTILIMYTIKELCNNSYRLFSSFFIFDDSQIDNVIKHTTQVQKQK